MDLRMSATDERFRAGLRQWLVDSVPRHGPPPPADDWPARRAYDTGWQRKLHDAGYSGLAWPSSFGGQGLPVSQQIVYYEECARAGCPSHRRELRRPDACRSDAHRRGHRRAACRPPAPDPHRRVGLVPGLLRTRRRLRSGVPARPALSGGATSTS